MSRNTAIDVASRESSCPWAEKKKKKKTKEKKKQRMRKLATSRWAQTDKRLTKLLRFKRFEQ